MVHTTKGRREGGKEGDGRRECERGGERLRKEMREGKEGGWGEGMWERRKSPGREVGGGKKRVKV